MKFFAKKKLFKRLLIIILLIGIFGTVNPKPVSADIGGILMNPIMSLFIGIADGVNAIIQKFFLNQDPTILVIADGLTVGKVLKMIIIGIGIAVLAATDIALLVKIAIGAAITLAMTIPAVGGELSKAVSVTFQTVTNIAVEALSDNELQLPIIQLSPYEIFSNKGDIFSVNVFKKEKEQEASAKTLISSLKEVVRDWYATLRLIAIVGMMSVLVYIGIRIIISSTAESKAKYKQMLWDWLMATCLIFVMHYIMIFANLLVDSITNMIDSIHVEVKAPNGTVTKIDEQGVEGFVIGAKTDDAGNLQVDGKSEKLIQKAYDILITNGNEITKQYEAYFWADLNGTPGGASSKILFWPAGNFTTQARMATQRAKREDSGAGDHSFIGYGLIYVVLTVYTLVFIWVYLRRLIYMVFLTLIAPLVALTYPIDKVKDGQAQAFNFWFREYLYNLLIQPLHLLLYIILVGTAMQFAAKNPIYVVVALGFMVPAEKLVKEMFGFKGSTPGAMPGMATGALMMGAARNIFGKTPKSSGGADGNGGSNSGNGSEPPGKLHSANTYNNRGLFGNPNESGSESQNEEQSGANNEQELDETGSAWDNYINNETQTNESPNLPSGGGESNNVPTTSNSNTGENTILPTSTNSNSNVGSSSTPELLSTSNDLKKKMGKAEAIRKALQKGVGRKVDSTIKNKRWWMQTGKNAAIGVAKGVGGAYLGATGLALGGIAGIVGGDPSKAASNMALGGIAGYKFGTGAGQAVGTGVANTLSNANNAIMNEYYAGNPDAYAERQMKEYVEKWKLDKKNLEILERNLGDKHTKELLKSERLKNHFDEGFTDPKDIIAIEKLIQEGFSPESARGIAQINNDIAGGDYRKLDAESQKRWRQSIRNNLKNAGYSEAVLDDKVKDAEGYMKKFTDYKKNIQ